LRLLELGEVDCVLRIRKKKCAAIEAIESIRQSNHTCS